MPTAVPAYTITNESITVVVNGATYVVQKSSPQFVGLKKAIESEAWDEIQNHLTVSKSLKTWSRGKFVLDEASERFSYEGVELPVDINARIVKMASSGEDPTPLLKFYERLQGNPSMRSVTQLYAFLSHRGIPITRDGCFLAYKGVKSDYTDCHTGKISNAPGAVNKMPRNKISDDPREACHEGYHVGALEYARDFGPRVVVCKVDPANVVCVPYDSGQQKMRVCEYTVLGHYGDTLPDTVFDEDTTCTDTDTHDDAPQPSVDEDGDEESSGPLAIPKKYKKLAAKPINELMKETIDTLRELATYGFKIVGASKIHGGKVALIAKIIEVRGTKA